MTNGKLFLLSKLIKYQASFARKHVFTREGHMLSSHVKRPPLLWLHNKKTKMKRFGISLVFI